MCRFGFEHVLPIFLGIESRIAEPSLTPCSIVEELAFNIKSTKKIIILYCLLTFMHYLSFSHEVEFEMTHSKNNCNKIVTLKT